jgi:hypothetical protein
MASLVLNGNTSGSVTISSPAVSGTTTLTLPTTSGTVLTNGTNTNFPAGSVLQVVNATYSTEVSSSSNVFADVGLTATITPKSATSKILVFVNAVGCRKSTGDTRLGLKLLRGATNILDMEEYGGWNATATGSAVGSCSTSYLDSPATTSATTYKIQLASMGNTAIVYVNVQASMTPTSTMTLMEIAA